MVGPGWPAGWRLTTVIAVVVPMFAVIIYQAVSDNRYELVVLSILTSYCRCGKCAVSRDIDTLFAGIPTTEIPRLSMTKWDRNIQMNNALTFI